MTDNIKMPPLPPWMGRYEIPDDDFEGGCANLDSRMRSYAREAVRLNAQTVPQQPVDEREAFEAIFPPGSGVTFDRDANGFYKGVFISEAWKVWQARAALSAPTAPLLERIAELEAELAEKDALLRQALDALEGFANITNDSQGVKGYHLNGDIAEWDEFDEVDAASNTIEAIRNHLGVKND